MDDDGLDLSAQLFELARSGGTDELVAFLDSGLPVDLADGNGETALMLAVSHQRPSLVRALLARGANPDHPNVAGETPRSRAARLKLTGIEVLIDTETTYVPPEDPEGENDEAPGPGGDLGPGAPG
ncbi:MAG: ankyrin repeat domain-containing protein [Actinomycetota bacterium]